MPLTRIRTDDLLSGSVSDGTLNATAITGQSAATTADDNDLILIYDDGASALRKMTRANFTSGITGDITAVTAGNGLSGGGNTGDVTLALDLNELSSADVAVASDSIAIIDANDSNASKKESIADVVTAIAGSGLAGSSGVLNLDVNELSALGAQAASADFLVMEDVTDNSTKKVLISNLPIDTSLSGAYTGGRFITASNGPIDIHRTTNNASPTTLLKLAISGSVGSAGVAGPEIQFGIPVSGDSEVGGAIRCTKWSASAGDSYGELQFLVTGDDETLDRILKVDYTGVAVQGLGSSEVYPSSGYAFMVAASGETNAMVVEQTTGDVGIGLTNPLVPLHVYRSDTSVSPQISAQQGSTGDAGFFLSIPNASYMLGIDNSDSDKFKIAYGNSSTNATLNSNPRFVIDTTGRVGINKYDPEALLDIVDTSISADDGFDAPENYHMFIEGSSTTNKYAGIGIGTTNDIGAAILFQDKGSFAKGDLIFMTKESDSNAVAPIERMRIRSDGETVLSASQFKITSTGDASIFIEADTDNATETDNPFLKMSQDGGLVASIIGHCGATDKDPENNTYTGAVSNNLLIGTLDNNGGVQIGTNDNVRITVESDGDVLLVSTKDDTTSSSANLFINSSTGFLARSTSDRRQKKAITAISSSLDDLCRLSPRHFYDVNDENSEVRIAGFVADEVQTVFPELVPERDLPDEIYRSVAYDRLGAYIVSAIKEIKQRLEALENGD